MNTKMKIAAGVAAGVIAGTTLVGTAFAAPRALSAAANGGYGMVRSIETSSTFAVPTIEQMSAFMNRYRRADGTFDMARMRGDVVAGKVTPPCVNRPARGTGAVAPRPGYGMMRGAAGSGVPAAGYGMMGSSY